MGARKNPPWRGGFSLLFREELKGKSATLSTWSASLYLNPPQNATLGELALYYASQGLWVFPLKPRGKKPLIEKAAGGQGFKDATLDANQIRAWWSETPRANIGIATGASKLVVLDPDGPEGIREMREVFGGPPPETWLVQTGRSEGFHVIYRGDDVPSTQRRGSKLDVRGTTGYIVAAGSIHENGQTYTVVNRATPIAPRPDRIKEWRQGVAPVAQSEWNLGPLPAYVTGARPAGTSLAIRGLHTAYSDQEAMRLRSALATIEPNIDGATWYAIGAALHDLHWVVDGIDQGFEIWDEWSRRSEGQGAGNGEYKGRGNLVSRWATFAAKQHKGPKFTVASIYAMAVQRGWNPKEQAKPAVETNGHDIFNGTNGVHALPPQFSEQSKAIHFPDLNKVGKPVATCRNARAAIRGLGLTCEHDLFHDKLKIGGQAIGEWAGDLSDNAVHMLRVAVERTYGFDPGTVNAHDAAVQECLQGAYDPVVDYLADLTWDGTTRLATWLVAYLGADDSAFTRAVGRLCLVAAVRRARQPGCKFDQIIVLEGPEGRGKSSAIELLAGSDNFSDQTILTLDDKGQQEALAGVWIFEIADFAGMGKADIEKTKAFASRKSDRARPAYGRMRVNQPRRCICFATTNNDTYLKSQTGNRRFWPVRCGRIDLVGLARDRDQIWAEAATLEAQGVSLELPEPLWIEAGRLQETRRDHDPWDELLAGNIGNVTADGRERRISSREIMEGRLQLPADKQNDVTAKRVAYTMRRLGWDGPKLIRDAEAVCRGYTKPVTGG